MKIKKIKISDFGKFNNLATIDELDNKMVLIYGENEAGKTTLFELIKTLFYGFKPATRDKNPNTSWKTNKIEFACSLEMDNDEKLEIHRRLLSTPSGKILRKNRTEEIRNDTIRQVSHISSEIYNKIFALKVEDLTDIKGEAWSEIQEKLLANFGSEDLVSVREVVKKINNESDSLYRKSKRGNQVIRDIKTTITELKQARKKVREEDQEIRAFDSEISRMKNELIELGEKKTRLKVFVKKAKEIIPVRKIINEIKKLEDKLVLKKIWETMRNQDIEKYPELKESIETSRVEIKRLEKSIKSQEEKIFCITDEEVNIYENRVLIETFKSEFSDLKQLRREDSLAKEEIVRLEKKIKRKWESISSEELDDEIRMKIGKININELSVLINRLMKLKKKANDKQDSYKKLKKQLEEEKPIRENVFTWGIGVIGILMGAIITIVGILETNTIIIICGIGILFIVFGAIFIKIDIIKKQSSNQRTTNPLQELTLEMNELLELLQKANKELEQFLDGIPVSRNVMEGQIGIFIATFMTIKDTANEINDKKEIVIGKKSKLGELENELNNFLNEFKYQNAIKEEEKLFELSNRAKKSEKNIVNNENIMKRIEELNEEIADKNIYLDKKKITIVDVEEKLKKLGNGEIEIGLENYNENEEVQLRIDFHKDELNKIPDYEQIIEEINLCISGTLYNDRWDFTEYELEKAENEIENITEEIKSFTEGKKEIEMKMSRLLEEKTLDEVESEIFIKEEELEKASIKYDKLLLMKEIINIADEQFKQENQPDVLKNASFYLQKITGSRYTHIMVEESDGEASLLLVKNNDLNKWVEVTKNQLSKGTLHQIYLALRMSLIDHLDKDNEKLPICFDELLVNWDDERLDNNLELLKEISNRRQVFIFTCHEWLVAKIEKKFNIKHINIGE